ncbi:MAG TPA: imidazoleglycerol-phosphate dehydratase HisB [Candidatus Binatia bacterium]|nr:imidazoleglycerol-phosphate dehydratase HisB [Candidatus Binatia bacterium]
MSRHAAEERITKETRIRVEVELDGHGGADVDVPLAFFRHMLESLIRHSGMDVSLHGEGDVEVDSHHLVEDCGLALGAAISRALGDRSGIRRFGHAYAPLDEALVRCALDFSNRPHLEWQMPALAGRINDFEVSVLHEFVRGLVQSAGISLHLDLLRGVNLHHMAEAAFKAIGLAIRDGVGLVGGGVPSTKGVL